MRTRNLLIPIYLLFLVMISQLFWSPIDGELASLTFADVGTGILSNKTGVLLTLIPLLPFLLTIRRPVQTLGVFPIILYILAAASLAWTYNVGATLYLLMILTTIFGYALAMNSMWGWERALFIIWLFASAVIATSIGLAIIGDPHALMGGNHDGAWRGLFVHKNSFGPFIVLHMFITLFGRQYIRLPLIAAVLVAFIDGGTLIFVHSSTAIVAAAAGIAAGMVFVPIYHRGLRFLWRMSAVLVLIASIGVATLDLDQIYELLGRDSTLAGRSQMWAQVYGMTFDHNLGTGYGTNGGSQVSIEIQKLVKRQDRIGTQSGYLNMALELGWIGVALFVTWLLSAMGTTLLAIRPSPAQALFVSTAVEHLVDSYSESFGCFYPSWSLAVLITALIAMRTSSPVRLVSKRRHQASTGSKAKA